MTSYITYSIQNYPGKVSYNWFGLSPWIDSSQNSKITVTKSSYVAGLQVIEDYCEQFNPHLMIEFSQQFVLQALTVYPYFEEALGSAKEWSFSDGMTYRLSTI